MEEFIRVKGASQHNLKGIDLDIPHRALTVVTGPSGSGKSSLVFDTIFAEAQRRYVESLSTYAKQFLERMERPQVEAVEGVSPAVAIQQKNPTKTSRSTVGTATEIHDYLRLLWARVGRTFCPTCEREIRPDTVSSAVDRVLSLSAGTRIKVTFPLHKSDKVSASLVAENLRTLGFIRVLADGEEVYLGAEGEDAARLMSARELLVVVDRLQVGAAARSRLADSLGTAFAEGEGEVVVLAEGGGVDGRLAFTEHFRCPDCGGTFPEPVPALFSFNNPLGACATCNGFGATLEFDLGLIVPDPERSLEEGAVDPWTKPRYEDRRFRLKQLARKHRVSMRVPWRELPERFRRIVLEGEAGFEGVLQQLGRLKREKRYKQYIRVFVRQYQTAQDCPACKGTRLRPEALNVKVAGRTIAEVSLLPVEELRRWVEDLDLGEHAMAVAETILRELRSRVVFLDEVGLGYLTLDRQARTLSGGEAQRISLANSLGSALVDVTYVLDEPSIGLHPRDTERLYRLLEQLRDLGNAVLVVEHDPAAIERADHVIELGPASGEHGGELVYEGSYEGLLASETLTGTYLSGREQIPLPERRRPVEGPHLSLEGARLHNLAGVDAHIPLGALSVVTGVSGSGKSTLVHDVLYRALERRLSGQTSAKQHLGERVGHFERLRGSGALSGAVLIDQSPIGRPPRSNPVTYLKAYAEIRRIFAELPESRRRKLGPSHFSFNVAGGRCEECQGAGQIEVEMLFLADVFVPCDSCGGKRLKPEVLEVRYRGRNIDDVLAMTVDEALKFFIKEDKLGEMLWQLQRVGLGYLRLGQPATTLSGGEAQRLKLARELAGATRKAGHKLYLLDEPTTGLHLHDVRKLLDVLNQLIEAGNTVLVIEHNLEVIKQADWIVDLGPGAGIHGGRVVAEGRPEAVAKNAASHTGRFLREVLQHGQPQPAA
ncbi:MAG: excinuclease ABC subunit UvrA [Gemmatimonadota bacterium]|nr:MAG: excinuclease ABC subunit UvrA [Gemmatimonadota bacterium]